MKRMIGDIFVDGIDGMQVVVVRASKDEGCKACAFATSAGGACPGVVYDRHPCCASDREDGQEVYFKLIGYVPEKKEKPLVFRPFGGFGYVKHDRL